MGALEDAKQNLGQAEWARDHNDYVVANAIASIGILRLLIDGSEADAREASLRNRVSDDVLNQFQAVRCAQAVDGHQCMYETGHVLPHRAWGPEGEFTWPADVEVAK